MVKKSKKKSIFKYILSLPFLGIFYVVDFFLRIINLVLTGIYFCLKPFI